MAKPKKIYNKEKSDQKKIFRTPMSKPTIVLGKSKYSRKEKHKPLHY